MVAGILLQTSFDTIIARNPVNIIVLKAELLILEKPIL